jgi:hypothetical protein
MPLRTGSEIHKVIVQRKGGVVYEWCNSRIWLRWWLCFNCCFIHSTNYCRIGFRWVLKALKTFKNYQLKEELEWATDMVTVADMVALAVDMVAVAMATVQVEALH